MAVVYFGSSSEIVEKLQPKHEEWIMLDTSKMLDIDMQTTVSEPDSKQFEP